MYNYSAGGLTMSHLLHSLSLFPSITSSDHPLICIESLILPFLSNVPDRDIMQQLVPVH